MAIGFFVQERKGWAFDVALEHFVAIAYICNSLKTKRIDGETFATAISIIARDTDMLREGV